MSYPQDPNNPYGQPEQNPYGQSGQNPYGQQLAQPQPGGLYDSGGNPAPFGQSGQNPYGQPGNPYDPNSAAPTQLYGQSGNPYGPPANPFDASGGGQIPQQPQPFGQPQQPYGAPGYPQQQPFYGGQPPAKSNTGMIVGIVVAAVVVIGVGGYFLASSHKNNPPNPLVATQATGQPPGAPSGSPAATGGGSGGGGSLGSFTPPATFKSNALEDDPGCGDFAGGEADFLEASFDLNNATEANAAFDKLATETTTSATDAEDPTLKSAFTAEAAYIKANEAGLSSGMVAYNASPDLSTTQFSVAYNPLKPTDEYINGVCGLASWSPTEP